MKPIVFTSGLSCWSTFQLLGNKMEKQDECTGQLWLIISQLRAQEKKNLFQ